MMDLINVQLCGSFEFQIVRPQRTLRGTVTSASTSTSVAEGCGSVAGLLWSHRRAPKWLVRRGSNHRGRAAADGRSHGHGVPDPAPWTQSSLPAEPHSPSPRNASSVRLQKRPSPSSPVDAAAFNANSPADSQF